MEQRVGVGCILQGHALNFPTFLGYFSPNYEKTTGLPCEEGKRKPRQSKPKKKQRGLALTRLLSQPEMILFK
jgi:hypothetical protein